MDSYLDDPKVEREEFDPQPETGAVRCPPRFITIRGVRYEYYCPPNVPRTRVYSGGESDGQEAHLVRLPGGDEWFFLNTTTGEKTPLRDL